MKRRSLKLLGLTSLLFSLCSLPVLVDKKEVTEVSAAQHAANFDEYDYKSYNGSYYSFVPSNPTEGLDGTLRTTLTSNILPKQWYSYSGSGTNTLSSILQQADEDPTNPSNMIYLYTRDSVKKNAAQSWNREHTWPKNLSNGCWGEGKAGADMLHIRPTYQTPNSTRSNNKFAEISGGTKKTYNGMDYGYLSGSNFMPLDSVKGDVARVIMYVWVAYKNYYGNLPAITNVFQSYDTLLKWHTQDKPDVMEAHRNDVAESSLQKNRNPFVDHPEYAWQIFGNSCSASVKDACKSAYPLGGGGGTTTTKTLISLSQSGTLSKTTYTVGDSFNPSGLTITANFSDGSSSNVTNQIEWSANTSSTGQKTVTGSYTYEGTTKEITLTITVINSDAGTKTLVSLETNGECKTNYTVGESFNSIGLEIIAHYSDGSSLDVTNQISWDADTSVAGEGTAIGQYTFGSSFQTVQIDINIVENPSPIIDDDDDDPPIVDDNPPVEEDEKEQGLVENLLGNLPGADLLKEFGCSANLSSTSIIIFASSVLGVALICFFKKREKQK